MRSITYIILAIVQFLISMAPLFFVTYLTVSFAYKKSKMIGKIFMGVWGVIYIAMFVSACIDVFVKKETDNTIRKYEGQYLENIGAKYPNVFPEQREILKKFKAQIFRKEERIDKQNKKAYLKIYDKENRLIYERTEYTEVTESKSPNIKGNVFIYTRIIPEEIGYVYDSLGRKIAMIKSYGGGDYRVSGKNSKNEYNFIDYEIPNLYVTKIEYPSDTERIETMTILDVGYNMYISNIKKYINNILVTEKEIKDSEGDDGFIIATVEKKYNEKGELIYKTVERKDKTNDYKSFTEMDFAKDEIVTKYYKGNDVFATVTENLVGPVETIEETEMDRGKEIKKVYKNKIKAIVKRQKVGEPVRIVDVIEFYDKEKSKKYYDRSYSIIVNTRYIFDEYGNLKYRIKGNKRTTSNYLFDGDNFFDTSFDISYLHDSFYSYNYKDNLTKYLGGIEEILEFIKNNKVISYKTSDKNKNKNINEILKGNVIKDSLEIIEEKEDKQNKIMTLEELLNGYKYE